MPSLVERVAARIPEFGVRLAYGDRTEVGGEELVPVALVAYGFGAGEGESDGEPAPKLSGSGGGGGGISIPVGAYVGSGGRLAFRLNPVALLVFGAPVVAALGVGIAAIVRAAR
jgi:uncharacterized spore protein YtfJ